MHALLSIKPEYAEKILKGEKLFEFRKLPSRKRFLRFLSMQLHLFVVSSENLKLEESSKIHLKKYGNVQKGMPELQKTFSSNISKEEIRPWQFKYSLINGMTSKLILMKNGIISSHHNLFVIAILLILPHPL